jgi:hypothetical protein
VVESVEFEIEEPVVTRTVHHMRLKP